MLTRTFTPPCQSLSAAMEGSWPILSDHWLAWKEEPAPWGIFASTQYMEKTPELSGMA